MASHHLYWLCFAHLLEFILRSSYDWFVWFHYTCSYETALCCVIRNADSHMSLQSPRFSAGALLGFQRMRLKFKDVCGFALGFGTICMSQICNLRHAAPDLRVALLFFKHLSVFCCFHFLVYSNQSHCPCWWEVWTAWCCQDNISSQSSRG